MDMQIKKIDTPMALKFWIGLDTVYVVTGVKCKVNGYGRYFDTVCAYTKADAQNYIDWQNAFRCGGGKVSGNAADRHNLKSYTIEVIAGYACVKTI